MRRERPECGGDMAHTVATARPNTRGEPVVGGDAAATTGEHLGRAWQLGPVCGRVAIGPRSAE